MSLNKVQALKILHVQGNINRAQKQGSKTGLSHTTVTESLTVILIGGLTDGSSSTGSMCHLTSMVPSQ